MATEVGNGQLGTLRLSHSSTVPISGRLLSDIGAYLQQQPGVSLDIGKLSSEAQLEELAEGRLDVGLLRLPVLRQREGIQIVPLFSERLLLAVPADIDWPPWIRWNWRSSRTKPSSPFPIHSAAA